MYKPIALVAFVLLSASPAFARQAVAPDAPTADVCTSSVEIDALFSPVGGGGRHCSHCAGENPKVCWCTGTCSLEECLKEVKDYCGSWGLEERNCDQYPGKCKPPKGSKCYGCSAG